MPDLQQSVIINLHQLFVFMLAAELVIAIPVGMVLKRLGLNMLWALLCFIPIAGACALWILAFIRWPRDAQPAP